MDTNRIVERLEGVEVERFAWWIAGGALALYGLTRRSLGGAALAVLGAGLVYRGIAGRVLSGVPEDEALDTVDEAGDESFPASDAPAWTATTSVGGS